MVSYALGSRLFGKLEPGLQQEVCLIRERAPPRPIPRLGLGRSLRNPSDHQHVPIKTPAAIWSRHRIRKRARKMRHPRTKILALAALALGVTTVTAEAANCQGRRDTGTAVGAIGGGLVGKGAARGRKGGTLGGVVIGEKDGNAIGGDEFKRHHSRHWLYSGHG